jgi:hypothetical protein
MYRAFELIAFSIPGLVAHDNVPESLCHKFDVESGPARSFSELSWAVR